MRNALLIILLCLLTSSAIAQDLRCKKSESTPSFVQCSAASGDIVSFNCPTGSADVLPNRTGFHSIPENQHIGCMWPWPRYGETIGQGNKLAFSIFYMRDWLFPLVSFGLGFLVVHILIKSTKGKAL